MMAPMWNTGECIFGMNVGAQWSLNTWKIFSLVELHYDNSVTIVIMNILEKQD